MSNFTAADRRACEAILGPQMPPSNPTSTPSSLYTMIPSMVRSRIPVLSSFRQTARSAVSRQKIHSRAWSLPETCVRSGRDSFSSGSNASTVASTGANSPSRPATPDAAAALAIEVRQDPSASAASALTMRETRSGVDWDVAGAGVRLWISARAQAEQNADPSMLRSMHIDALRYMHMALPADLSAAEVQLLRSAASPQLSGQDWVLDGNYRPARPNLLRQGVATAVCWVVAFLFLLIPLLMTLMNRVLRYEREHQITERVVTNSADLARVLGERGLDVGNAMVKFKQSPLGNACYDTASWVIEGVAGGVNDGLIQSTNGAVVIARRVQ